jgi:hypothetical protein
MHSCITVVLFSYYVIHIKEYKGILIDSFMYVGVKNYPSITTRIIDKPSLGEFACLRDDP